MLQVLLRMLNIRLYSEFDSHTEGVTVRIYEMSGYLDATEVSRVTGERYRKKEEIEDNIKCRWFLYTKIKHLLELMSQITLDNKNGGNRLERQTINKITVHESKSENEDWTGDN